MARPFTVENEQTLTEGLGSGRADYTTDIISNVDVTVQAERLEAVIKRSTENIVAGAAGAYDSGFFETGDYNKIIGILYANQDATIYLEQSIDGSTLHSQTTQAYTTSTPPLASGTFSFELTAPYFRLRVIAAVTTTTFSVWSRLSNGA